MPKVTHHTLPLEFIDQLSDLVVIIDREGKIVRQNKAFSTIYLISSGESLVDLSLNSEHLENLIRSHTPGESAAVHLMLELENRLIDLSGHFSCLGKNQFLLVLSDKTREIYDQKTRLVYSKIGDISRNSSNLPDLLSQIHQLLKKEIGANNLSVCLINQKNELLDFPYNVDEELHGQIAPYQRSIKKGLIEYVLKNQEALLLREADITKLVDQKKIVPLAGIPKIWLGVPLVYNDHTIGVIAVKSHSNRNKFDENDLDLLKFISLQISFVIEKQKYEDRLIAQSAILESIIESGEHLIWSVNRERTITSFNSSYGEMIYQIHGEYPTHDRQSKILLLSDPKFEKFVSEKYDLAFKGESQHYETSFEDKDGKITWREMFLNPIYSNHGTIDEISGIAHDITRKKRIELELVENEQKFRNIFESLQDIYIKINHKDLIEIVSPSVEQVMGYTPAELIGQSVHDFFEEVKPKDLDRLQYLLENNKSAKNFGILLNKKNGRKVPGIINFTAITGRNNVLLGMEGVIRDISEIQQVTNELKLAKKEAEESLKIKESFLANMSHEIRTPMNGIVAMVDLLSETKLSRSQIDFVGTLRESSHILLNILNDILDLSKLEAGKMEVRKESISVVNILQKTYLLFSQKAKSKNIKFNFYSSPDIPGVLISDETRLIQILSNLVSNALKFTPEKGEVSLTASSINKKDSSEIRFQVKDNGIGIKPENLKKLFRSFNQLDSSITKEYGGTGLGLSISNELCRILGGEIKVDSKYGRGSTFFFSISMEKVKASEQNIKKTEPPKRNLKNLRILLVDDMEVNRKVASLLLEKQQALVQVASNGKEALSLANTGQFDVILMDVQMPVMDGITALYELKKLDRLQNTKIVAMTAYSMEKDRDKFLSLGFDNYLSKPVTAEKLIQSILDEPLDFIERQKTANLHSIFDESQVQNIKDIGGNEMFIDLLYDFKHESDGMIEELENALKQHNKSQILDITHSIKGSSGSVGLKNISNASRFVEQSLQNNIQIDLRSSVEEVFKEYKTFVNWLKLQEK